MSHWLDTVFHRYVRVPLVLCALSFMLTSCWDSSNLELVYFANAVGIDFKDGQYEAYTQIANFHAMQGGGESPPRSDVQVYVGLSKGKTLGEAAHRLYSHTQRKVHWGHLSAIVFSENVLQEDILEALEVMSRFYTIRHTVWLYAAQDPLKEVLTTPTILDMGAIYSAISDPMESYVQSSFVEPIRMHRYFTLLSEPERIIYLPMIGKEEGGWFEDGNKGVPNLYLCGAAVMQGSEYKGKLTMEEMNGVRWMQPKSIRSPLVLERDGEALATVMLNRPQAKIETDLSTAQPAYSVRSKVAANVIELFVPMTDIELKHKVSEQVEQEIRHTFAKGLSMNVDLLQLTNALYRKNNHEWKKIKENGADELTASSLRDVEVEVTFVKTGKDKMRNFVPND